MGICLSNQMSFGNNNNNNNNNKHDDIHHTAINQSNCNIGLGEQSLSIPYIQRVHMSIG
jgi:hypothetical protein